MSAKDAGGLTHIRYGHACRPARIDVRCRRCAGRAIATLPGETARLIGDMHPRWNPAGPWWTVQCAMCLAREPDVAYRDLPPLFWQASFRHGALWAWNREHLGFLIRYLQGAPADAEPYGWLAAYVPGRWKSAAPEAVQRLSRLLR